MENVIQETKYPIRLVLGRGDSSSSGLIIVYEKPNGKAGQETIWYCDSDYGKIKFIDGESYISYKEIDVEPGFFSKEVTTKIVLNEVAIDRRFMK